MFCERHHYRPPRDFSLHHHLHSHPGTSTKVEHRCEVDHGWEMERALDSLQLETAVQRMALRRRQVELGGSRMDIGLVEEGEGAEDSSILRTSEVVAMVGIEQLVADRLGHSGQAVGHQDFRARTSDNTPHLENYPGSAPKVDSELIAKIPSVSIITGVDTLQQ